MHRGLTNTAQVPACTRFHGPGAQVVGYGQLVAKWVSEDSHAMSAQLIPGRTAAIFVVSLLASIACSTSDSDDPQDSAADAQVVSADGPLGSADAMPGAADANIGPDADTANLCAEPGAVGNSAGVGKYCQTNADCGGQSASLCTIVQQPDAPPFCTKVCFGVGDECGENASCEGDGTLKGCTPTCVLD